MERICGDAARILICTQSEALARRLYAMLRRWACSECVALTVERVGQPQLPELERAQLLFLDLDSVRLPERGRLDRERQGMIVISGDAGRAIRSYRWHPSAFLKPEFDRSRLSAALNACERCWQRGRSFLESPYPRRSFRLPLGSVRYVEAAAHYCLFFQERQSVRIRCRTGELDALLPSPPFIRCHRSYLVHLDAVESMRYTELTLKGGTRLPLGRTYVIALQEALAAWRKGEINDDVLHHDLRRSAGGAGPDGPDAPQL